MPIRSRHRLEGQRRQAPRGLLVQVEDGGVWALDADADADADAEALVGKRVKVEGTRTGFDCIDVEWIVAA